MFQRVCYVLDFSTLWDQLLTSLQMHLSNVYALKHEINKGSSCARPIQHIYMRLWTWSRCLKYLSSYLVAVKALLLANKLLQDTMACAVHESEGYAAIVLGNAYRNKKFLCITNIICKMGGWWRHKLILTTANSDRIRINSDRIRIWLCFYLASCPDSGDRMITRMEMLQKAN
jgi:hypothetical protein